MADDLSAILEALRSLGKNSSLSRLLSEEQQDVTKYLAETSEELIKLAQATVAAREELNKHSDLLETQARADKALYDEYHKEFERLTQTGMGLQDVLATMISNMEKGNALEVAMSEQLKKRLELEKDLEKAEMAAREAEKRREKEKDMLEKIKTNAQSNIGGIFGSLGIKFEGDPENMNALYMGLDLIMKGETQKGIRLLSFYADKAAEAWANMLSPLNIAVNMLGQFKTQTLEVFLAVDTITAQFLKATGATQDFSESITDAWDEVRGSNLSLEDMSETMKGLMEGYRGFTLLSKQARTEAVVFNSLVNRLGVSAATTTKIFSFFADTLQQGVQGAKASFSDLLGLVETTGETLDKITKDFEAALPTLARYGSQTNTIFKQVFATAKALRIETSELLEVTSHFDTFEDAATSVGKLNAILGGPYLNAIQMMQQSEAERIATLNSAFKATGKSWQQLDKYGRMAIAAAAGITDMNLATKIFTGSTAEANHMLRQAALEQEELAKKNQRATELAEAWKNVLMQIGQVMQPFIDLAHMIVGAILDVADAFGDLWPPLRALAIPLLLLAGSAFLGFKGILIGLVKKIATSIIPGLGKLISKVSDITGAGAAAGDALKGLGGGAAAAAPPVKGLGAALGSINGVAIAKNILFIGGAIAIVIASFIALKDIAEGIGGVFKGVGKFVQGLGEGFYQWVTESPLEELEDLINTVKEAGPGIGKELQGIGSGMAALVEGFNTSVSKSTVESFTDLMGAIAENSGKLVNTYGIGIIDSYTRLLEAVSEASITPTSIENIKSFTETLVSTSEGAPAQALQQVKNSEPQIQVKIFIDGEELKNSVSKVVITELGNKLDKRVVG